jgi:hypothetical protein
MKYLSITPDPTKWYISEGFIAGRGKLADNDLEKSDQHNKPCNQMIIAGPFDSEVEASGQLANYSNFHEPYVWQPARRRITN